ncbi:hypothetical protein [Actinomadura hibisca]|uniref:hypothetical protein n=1 Tax=Actinomadura hibisca TaxID=68565 RepID=UPI000ADBD73C|nr:hypothetical protein [Actinomadura hibisca]
MSTQADLEAKQINQLRTQFTGHRIWRSVRSDGLLGDWVASLHDPAHGVDPTVIRSDADEPRKALLAEAGRAPARSLR